MTKKSLPRLDVEEMADTRDALHAWARIVGGWLKSTRTRRKHWWHISLRPSLRGLSTGVVRGGTDFEIELDFVASALRVRTADQAFSRELHGQSPASAAAWLDDTLADVGVDRALAPGDEVRGDEAFAGYSRAQALAMHHALAGITAALEDFRSGILEETSPIQVWPHHFDLSMIWLPGAKVPGQDPENEEHADKQMNFGFVFGDAVIQEPYLYVTAYPLPDALPRTELPAGTRWLDEGFSGAVLKYRDLVSTDDPPGYLLNLWSRLIAAGRSHLATND